MKAYSVGKRNANSARRAPTLPRSHAPTLARSHAPTLISLLTLLLACRLPAAERPAESPQPHAFVIGISPFLDKSVKDDVYRGIVRLLVQDLPLNSTLAIYDAFNLKTVTQVSLPNQRAFNSPKTRANQFAPAISDLKHFLATDHPKPVHAALQFQSALRLPQFYDFLAEKSAGATGPVNLLLLGSPVYEDAKEPGFSMVNGFFPSDGHLLATRENSVYGLSQPANALPQLAVSWVYFGDPWVNDLYQEKVSRFWALFLRQRGASLVLLSGDLPSGLAGLHSPAHEPAAASKSSGFASGDPKLEMLRVSRSVEITDWLTRDSLPEAAQRPPSVMVGPIKIGIRWQDNIDLDLYATPRHGAETLFFQHPRSPEGYYYKDHRSSPGKEYEFIEFEKPVDIRQVQAFVNFYKGSCEGGPRGEVRIEFEGKIYGAPFSIAASRGNRGRAGDDQQEHWVRLPVQRILKLAAEFSVNGGRDSQE
jgi:hypothetical protein